MFCTQNKNRRYHHSPRLTEKCILRLGYSIDLETECLFSNATWITFFKKVEMKSLDCNSNPNQFDLSITDFISTFLKKVIQVSFENKHSIYKSIE